MKTSLTDLIRYVCSDDERERDQLRRSLEHVLSKSTEVMMGKSEDHGGVHLSAEMLRDLVVGTAGTGGTGGTAVSTDRDMRFFDLVRDESRIFKLGANLVMGLRSNVAFSTTIMDPQVVWLSENTTATESQPSLGSVSLSPKTCGAFLDISRQLRKVAPIGFDALVGRNLARAVAIALEKAAISGAGGTQPSGLMNTAGVGAVLLGTNGGPLTYDAATEFERQLAGVERPGGTGFLTTPDVRKKARNTLVGNDPLWDRMERIAPAYAGALVPNNLTKGTTTNACSAVLYGFWADLLVGVFGGIEIVADPFTQSTSGALRLSIFVEADVAVARASSFAMALDATTT